MGKLNMIVLKAAVVLCVGLLLLAGTTAEAQTLVINGTFGTNVDSWTNWSDRFEWVSDDGSNPSGNGCAEQGEDLNNGATSTTEQILAISADTNYTFSASVKLPVGSSATSAWLMIDWLDSGQSWLGESLNVSYLGDLSDNAWHDDFVYTGVSPSYAAFVNLRVGVGLPSEGTVEAVLRWDNVFFGIPAAPGAIFDDGFESNALGNWSSTTP